MKKLLHILRPVALIGIGLLLAILSAAVSQPEMGASDLSGVAFGAAVAPTATAIVDSEVGSTDGITLVSILIVLIVMIPILARRKSWDY